MSKANLMLRYDVIKSQIDALKLTNPFKALFFQIELKHIDKIVQKGITDKSDWSGQILEDEVTYAIEILEDFFTYVDKVMEQDATSFDI
jgi:hypothetical protein